MSEREATGELFRLLVNSVRDYAIFVLDPRGHVLTWNPGARALKGYEAEEIIGKHFSVFYPEEDLANKKPEMEIEVATEVGRFEDEGWRKRKDGSMFWANVVITALRDESGTLTGFAKITRDLTERKLSEERAVRIAAETAAREVAEHRGQELAELNLQLQQQAAELEAQTEEAQSVTEELEQTNEQLQDAIIDVESAREAALHAESYVSSILASITDPFVVYDKDWRFRYINEAGAKRLVGTRHEAPDEIIGQVVWEMFPNIVGTEFERALRRSARDRTALTLEAYYPERAEWTAMYSYPLPDGGLATQWKNVTDRKRTEEAAHYLARATDILNTSLDYQETLTELANLIVPQLADWCGVEIVGEDSLPHQLAVAHVNPDKVRWARELNRRYPPDQNSATGVPNVIRTGKSEIYPEIPEELLEQGAVDAEHLRIIRELALKSAMVVPLIAHGVVLGALSFVSSESGRKYTQDDLTLAEELARRAALAVDNARRHQAELSARHAAEKASRAKSDFLAVMSHELRTPLNAIAGHAQIIEMGLHGPVTEGQKDALERIGRAQRHLLGLINNVLNLTRIETGRVFYDIRPTLVSTLLNDLTSLVEPQFTKRAIALTMKLPENAPGGEPILVMADREKLTQILTNVLGNAAKFTPDKGQVVLELMASRSDPRTALIVVSDTGPGIQPDMLEAIFEPFVQLERIPTSPTEGTGLGLAISRDLARGMGGDLRAENVDGGASFILSLPRASADDAPRPRVTVRNK